jgi:polygalacturonase
LGFAAVAGPLLKARGRWDSSTLRTAPADPWGELPGILARIRAPQFANRDFSISEFGAVGDNKTDCTQAFRRAVGACHAAGGGRVTVPQGEYLTGAIHLLSGVNLHVPKEATIRFLRNPAAYPLVFTRWEGTELMNFSPFIYAFEQTNIAITGEGTIDGNSDDEHWWLWKGRRSHLSQPAADQTKDRNLLHEMGEKGVPVNQRIFGQGHYLRPQFIQPYRCKNVLIEGVALRNSPMWHLNPVLCSNVIVRNLSIRSSGPNTDGCDPESCKDVLIEGCTFNTGDDCIAIKSGRNADGRRLHVRSENIVIRDCHMKEGHGGATLGSEISGGVRNVFVEDCRMDGPHLHDALRIKNNAMRGGVLEDIYARNITVGQVAMAGLSIDFYYEEGANGAFTPVVGNVNVRNLSVQQTKYALYLRGFKNAPIRDVRLTDCNFVHASRPSVVENVERLSLKDVDINGQQVHSAKGSGA